MPAIPKRPDAPWRSFLIRVHSRSSAARALLVLAALLLPVGAGAQRTPPVAPKVQETPLPPPVELPAPAELAADVPARPLTADEAAAIALRRNPSVSSAQASIAVAQGRLEVTRAALRPTLGLSAGYTNVQSPLIAERAAAGGSASAGSQGSATVRRLLFDQRHTRDLVRQASAQEDVVSGNLARVQSDLVLQVKQAFYAYAQNTRLVAVNEANVRDRQKHLAQAQARLAGGLGLPLDVVRAQTAISAAILNLNLAHTSASTARVQLALLMGLDPRTRVEAADGGEGAPSEESVEALIARGMEQRPEVRQAQASLEAARAGIGAARTTNAPTVTGSAGFTTRGANVPPRSDSFSISAVVQWSPFDGGVARGRIEEAQAGVESAEAQIASAQLSVVADVSQAYLNLKAAEQRVVTAEAEIANAQESVRLAEGRYNAGVGIFIDVTDAQTALLTARTNHINAQTAVAQARAALSRAVGAPLPSP